MLSRAIENLKFDVRMHEWNLVQGHVKREELQRYLQGLPDLADRVVKLKLDSDRSQSHAGNGAAT